VRTSASIGVASFAVRVSFTVPLRGACALGSGRRSVTGRRSVRSPPGRGKRASTPARMRVMTCSSVGYGPSNGGLTLRGSSSIRYTVPGAVMPVVAVVMCTLASLLVCETCGSMAIVGTAAMVSMAGPGMVAPGSAARTSTASTSRRVSRSMQVNSPGL